MKLGKLVDSKFKDVLKRLSEEKLPLKSAFKLKGIIKKTNEELAKYEELRLKSLSKYADKDENGEMILNEVGNASLTESAANEFVKELNELSLMEVEVGTLKASELGENIDLSAGDLLTLDGLVAED